MIQKMVIFCLCLLMFACMASRQKNMVDATGNKAVDSRPAEEPDSFLDELKQLLNTVVVHPKPEQESANQPDVEDDQKQFWSPNKFDPPVM